MIEPSFLGLPVASLDRLEADVAILGIPHGTPYPRPGLSAGCAGAPSAIRQRAARMTRFSDHHDFDSEGPMLPTELRIVDCGDVPGTVDDPAGNRARAESAVRAVLAAGTLPIFLGGDDSTPIPVLAAFAEAGPLTVLQVDAHLDFRDEVQGERLGYSSPMRRASEMPHVAGIVQVGLRGAGSARSSDVADARAAGNLLVTARELRRRGVPWLLDQLPAQRTFISLDLDGLDPSVCPGVSAFAPGGLSYDEAWDIVSGVARSGRLAGMIVTELLPERDVNELSALVAARLVLAALQR
ncbi:MAG: arginase family protein [Chloroflexota bacterium]